MDIDIKHVFSEENLSLISSTKIDGKTIQCEIKWDTLEEARKNLQQSKKIAARQLRALAAESSKLQAGSKNTVRNLFSIGDYEVQGGLFRGNSFDNARFVLGQKSWVADLYAENILWNTLREDKDSNAKKRGFRIGGGGARNAAYLEFRRKA